MKFNIEEIKRKMSIKYGFFGSVLANVDYKVNNNIPTAATDGKNIYYNTNFLNGLDLDQQLFTFAHETCHIAFDHIRKSEGKIPEIWNIATDAVINQLLIRDGLKMIDGAINMPEAINYDSEQFYEKLLKERNNNNSSQTNKNDKQKNQSSSNQNGQGGSSQDSNDSQDDNKNQNAQGNSSQDNKDSQDDNKNQNAQGGSSQDSKDSQDDNKNQNAQGNSSQDNKDSQDEDKNQDGQDSSSQDKKDSKENQNSSDNSSQDNKDSQDDNKNQDGKDSSSQDKENSNDKNEDDEKDVGHDTHSMWKDALKKIKENDKKSKELQDEIDKISKMGEKKAFKKNLENKRKELEKLKDMLSQQSMGAGNFSNGNQRVVNEIGKSKQILDWRYVLREAIKYDVDWSYKNAYIEDGVLSAALEEQPMPETEIVLDTSGSINEILLRNFLRECKNILQYSRLKVGCFDIKFYGFHEIRNEDDIEKMEFQGGGGTDFNIAVRAFTRRVENKIIFTDGQADMPDMPMDAIWIVFGEDKINPKGGRVILINREQLDRLYSDESGYSYRRKNRNYI